MKTTLVSFVKFVLLILSGPNVGCSRDTNRPVLEDLERVYNEIQDFPCYDEMTCTPERCNSGNFTLMTNYKDFRSCDCDDGCQTFGTCCFNYEEVCLGSQHIEDLHFKAESNVITCENMLSASKSHDPDLTFAHYFVISKCKRPLLDGLNDDDVQLCENLGHNFEQFIPVYHESLLYRNLYCLRCNALNAEDSAMFVGTGVECWVRKIEELGSATFETQSLADLQPFLESKSCHFVYDMSFPHLYCYKKFNDKCDPSLEASLPEFSFFQNACRSYAFYVERLGTIDNIKYFKNPHCAQCNGITNVSCILGDESPSFSGKPMGGSKYNYVPTLSVLLDFSGQVSTKLIALRDCNYTSDGVSYLDMKTNTCLSKLCPPGHIIFNSTHCIVSEAMTFKHLHSGTVQDPEENYGLQIFLKYRKPLDFQSIGEKIQTLMSKERPRKSVAKLASSSCTTEDEIFCVEFLISTNGFYDDILFITQEEFSSHLEELDAKVDIVEIRFVAPFSQDIDDLYHSANPKFTMNETRMADTMRNTMNNNYFSTKIYVYLPEFGSTLSLQQMHFDTRVSKDDFGIWSTRQAAAVDIETHFNCSKAGACIVYRYPNLDEWEIESTLTRWFSLTSIAALCVSLSIRCAIPDELTFHKVMQVCLLVSLLLAHLFFVVNNFVALPGIWCTVDASLQHFSWLASFAFMNVVNLMLCRAFNGLRVKSDVGKKSKLLYMLYGLGFPGVVVMVTCIVHFFMHPVYADQGVCWIDGATNLGVAFGLPLAVMLTMNIILFSTTAVLLRRAMKQTERVTDVYTFKYRLHLHLRLFTIMGGTWVFGFLSNIPRLQFLSYAFVILVSLNGFFVALAFTINSEMIKTIKSRISSWTSFDS